MFETGQRLHPCDGFGRWPYHLLKKLFTDPKIGCTAYNLGTGQGTSVLEMVAAFEKTSGKKIPIKLCPRRSLDATEVYASTEKAEKELGWKAKCGVDEMCRDQWDWANNNPWGLQEEALNFTLSLF
ncbi:hypothetical protein AALP_AAs41255U000100 [Arabis alpina]|uniref:UDP-glucose 4-epimerase n=1 Tax=Arabis alpina TaxID=50452 RepID=A0A087G2P0_ARAAL|nr:hypothetical protein AALP_AAs41255U000100 [Arabis alpina]